MFLSGKDPEVTELVTIFKSFPAPQRKSILKELGLRKAMKLARNLDSRKAKGKKLSERQIMETIVKIRKASNNG